MKRLFSIFSFILFSLIFFVYFELRNLPIPENDYSKVIAHTDSRTYKIPLIFSDGAVIQRNKKISITGNCYNRDVIKIIINKITRETQCQDGQWILILPPMEAGGPYDMNIEIGGENNFIHIIKNIYYGEVWIASGQSNMVKPAKVDLENSTIPINVFRLSSFSYSFTHWKKLNNLTEFSAVATHFSKELSTKLEVPIGIILIAEGSSTIAHWHPYNDSSYYNSVIKKIYPLPFKGVIWWQGESDALVPSYPFYKKIKPQLRSWIRQYLGWNWEGSGNLYLTKKYNYEYLFKSLIKEWRQACRIGDFPFVFVQLQKYYKEDGNWERIREAQESALQLPKTAMVISYDITDGKLHPKNTKLVAFRLAKAASRFYEH